ncbi:MAG: hypothetical protein LBH26_04745, partial [Treponema sp.]|jgi:hypothetical protein|nr:hypothetical protein [Treponema sp.]
VKKIAVLLFAALLAPAFVFGEDMAPLTVTSTRNAARGGPHVAYTDDVHSLFVNPAALQKANQWSFFELSPALVGPLFEIVDIATSSDPGKALGELARDQNGKIPLGLELRGPVSFAYTANGLGFGVWEQISVDTRIRGVDIQATAMADFILNYGMSFRLLDLSYHQLDAGFVVKPFLRGMAYKEMSGLDLVDNSDLLLEDFTIPIIMGAGFDLGFMYRFYDDLALGLTIGDVFTGGRAVGSAMGSTPDTFYRVPMSLNMGLAYTFKLGRVWKGAPSLLQSSYAAFMFDWRNLNEAYQYDDYTKRNPSLNLGIGLELGFFDFVKIRMGLNEMLPTFGIGLEPGPFQFNFAMYGKELGNEPGRFSTYVYDFSIAIRPEAKKQRWPWTRRALGNLALEKAGVLKPNSDKRGN